MNINPSFAQKVERNKMRISLIESILDNDKTLTKEQRGSFQSELDRRNNEMSELRELLK